MFGGSLSEAHAEKVIKVQDMALRNRAPIIGLYDAGGARIQEGVAALGGYAEIFQRNVLASGVIPQISVIMGPCAGGDVYSPAMTDFIFMVRDTSYMFVTGPDVVKTVTNETVTAESLGGASVHTTKSSIADGAYDNDVEALLQMRRLVDLLPASNTAEIPEIECYQSVTDHDLSLDRLIPDNANKPYDIKELILKIADEGDFFEIQQNFRQEHRHRLRPRRGPHRRLRRQPADGAGRRARFRRQPQGGALRALLRLLLHPDRHLRRRARLPARHRAGIWRADQARRQAAVRLCRGDRAEDHRHHPQSLWRRL